MSTLFKEVSGSLAEQGLEVEEDRGGLVVRAGPGASPTTLWIDETDRVVRAERVLVYPVDDFSEYLGQALDWLNANRAGVTYAFQESQRAIVGRTSWFSPNRSPAANQLHLLVALLDQAKQRDAVNLAQVAEGDAEWDAVAEGNDMRLNSSATGAPPPGKDPLTLRFTTSRFDPEELLGGNEPATQPVPSAESGGWLEPPTRSFDAPGSHPLDGPETQNFSREELAEIEAQSGQKQGTGAYSRKDIEDLVNDRPEGPSRNALALAVQQLDQREDDPPKEDEGPSVLGRLLRILVFLVAGVGILGLAFVYLVAPFVPKDQRFWEKWNQEILVPELTPLEKRRQLPMGRELLEAELRDPLEGSQTRIEGSLAVLGDKGVEVLEELILVTERQKVRQRAYELWTQKVEGSETPNLKLLKRIQDSGRKRTKIVGYLTKAIKASPPKDEVLIKSLAWSRGAAFWPDLITLLGRPGEGAQARAKALEAELPNDTPDCVVLRALIQTGYGSADAVDVLIKKRGVEWCNGKEGRGLLLNLIKREPNAADGLVGQKGDRTLTLLGIRLLQEAKTIETIKKLTRIVFSSKEDPWVRERAAEALRGKDAETIRQASWSLVYVLNDPKSPPSLQARVQETLQSYGDEAVPALERYTTRDRSSTRRYALVGLGALESPGATTRILARLKEEDDARLRRQAIEILAEHAEKPTLRRLLERNLMKLRTLSKNDPDARVRRSAEKLYRKLTAR